ncbi:MAG: Hpt domain-containing protein [Pseudomonadota bacterium]
MQLPQRLIDLYFKVSRERLQEMEKFLSEYQKNPEDKQLKDKLYRLFHNIHSSGAVYGFHDIGDAAGIAELLFQRHVSDNTKLSPEEINLVLKKFNFIRSRLEEYI